MNKFLNKLPMYSKKALVLALFLWLLVAAGTRTYYSRQQARIRAQEEDYHGLLLNIAENGVRAHVRDNVYHPDFLEDWFTGLVVAADLGGLLLRDGNEADIVRTGAFYSDLAAEPVAAYSEIRKQIPGLEALDRLGWRRRGGGPRGRGAGTGGGWRPLPPGPYTFTIAVDTAPWRERYGTLKTQSLLGSLLAMACAALVAVLIALREHQRRLRDTLVRAEAAAARQALLARLGAGLAHETKNPLGLIRGMAQRITDTAQTASDVRERAARIIDEADRVAGQIDNFLSLAKPAEPELAPLCLEDLFQKLHTLMRDEAADLFITFTVESSSLCILADAGLLRKALLNLVLNAFKACKKGDTVAVRAEKEDDSHAAIVVTDTGCGIAAEDLPHITEPYYSQFEEGVGLGLTLVSEIALQLGGCLEVESELGGGTTVRLAHLSLVEEES